MSTLRAAQKRMTYELFLDKGLELFGEKGYAATTVDLHFASKAELMSALLERVDTILTAADDPTLTEVIQSGSRELIRTFIDRKITQWDEIKPYLAASYQAAHEPAVVEQTEAWFQGATGDIERGLDLADRLPADSRRMRAILAFGQLEYVSRRYFAVGWATVERQTALEELTDSWCHLVGEDA